MCKAWLHLSNIWSSIHETTSNIKLSNTKLSNTKAELKKALLIEKAHLSFIAYYKNGQICWRSVPLLKIDSGAGVGKLWRERFVSAHFLFPTNIALRKKCLYSELFWSAFSRFPVRIPENTDQNNSKY